MAVHAHKYLDRYVFEYYQCVVEILAELGEVCLNVAKCGLSTHFLLFCFSGLQKCRSVAYRILRLFSTDLIKNYSGTHIKKFYCAFESLYMLFTYT